MGHGGCSHLDQGHGLADPARVSVSVGGETLAPCGWGDREGSLVASMYCWPTTRMIRVRNSDLVVHCLKGTMGVPEESIALG